MSSSELTKYHDSVIPARCFVDTSVAWCYGEIIITICGLITLVFSIWCLYRMIKYQNESKSAVRSFIIYLSIILSLLSILHALFIEGSTMSLTASFLVSVQCSLFTVFFIKICIRTNSNTLSISMDCERLFQIIFLLIMNTVECALYIWSLIKFDEKDIDCHSPPFVAFSCIDVIQILFTIIAVCFIKRKIQKQHQKVALPFINKKKKRKRKPNISLFVPNQSSLIAPNENISPPIQPLSVNDHEYKNNGNNSGMIEEKSLGQIQMLQKSHQLLILVLCIFVCAIVTAVYETWNSLTKEDCITFINGPHTDVINEIFRLIARITWLFIPSWLIIYVFWIWPERPKKYVSDDSLRRKELKRQQNIEKRNEILNKICCYCFTNNNNNNNSISPIASYNEFNNVPNDDNYHRNELIDDNDNNNNNNHHKSSMYNYDADNRIINDNDNEEEQIMYDHKSSVVEYHSNDNNGDDEQIMYNRQISDDFNESSSSSLESDSMRNSHIWDQHITTENIRPVVTPSVSNVLSGSIAISAKQNINQS